MSARAGRLMRRNFLSFGVRTQSVTTKAVPKESPKRSRWKSVIGLEVHAQIQTSSKLFSGAGVEFGAPVNTCVALLDASIPGTLPVLNRRAVELAVQTALALDCNLSAVSMFDRKHYFYADLPAGYQITQQRAPLARGGVVHFPVFVPGVTREPYYKAVRLHQLQLEQDSGKSLHDTLERKSLVDLNRAGVPLMELVFEPDLETGEEAAALVKELILILTRLGSCSCRMEEGALRVDANISVHEEGTPLGTRTEVKNIGSVRAVALAVEHEIHRQRTILDNGGTVHNETRAWDATDRTTVAMRDKEVVQDYRFMPEPNLPPLHLNLSAGEGSRSADILSVRQLRSGLPELPEASRQRIVQRHGLPPLMAIILVNEPILYRHFHTILEEKEEKETQHHRSPKMVANFLINELLATLHRHKVELEQCPIGTGQLAELVDLLHDNRLNSHYARQIIEALLDPSGSSEPEMPSAVASRNDWWLITDDERIGALCREAVQANPKLVEQYRKGKGKMLYALAGIVAKACDQKVDMVRATEQLKNLMK